MQKVGLDPHEEGRLSEQEMCLWRRLSQLEMHQKMGEEEGGGIGGRRNDEENECRGISRRRRGAREGDLGLWQECASLNYPTYMR